MSAGSAAVSAGSAAVSVSALVAEHGSPLWLADTARFEHNLERFSATWRRQWPDTLIAYSYKTNRLEPFLEAVERHGAGAEVAGAAEYELAAEIIGVGPARIVVDGPAKPDRLLEPAAQAGALILADSATELDRAAAFGAREIGLRVALQSFTGARTRFGIAPDQIPAAARHAAALGLRVRALSTHLVSTDFDAATKRVVVRWPRPAGEHAHAARVLAALSAKLTSDGHPVDTLDLGGGFPGADDTREHARAVAAALAQAGFRGRLVLEPGRALVSDAVALAFTVVSVKTLADGSRCVICDAGTNLLPGARSTPPAIEAPGLPGPLAPALVSGPLCLNVDVLDAQAMLPALEPGALLVARDVGAYEQVASTQFGEPRPAVLVGDGERWQLHAPAEELRELVHQD